MGRGNAAACYRELGAEMRRLREAAGLTGRSIARKTKWDPTRVSRIESGQINIDVADLCWYLGILRVDRDVALPLIDLCRQAKEDKGFWLSQHGEWIPDTLSSLIYHESTASLSIGYEPMVVPGLLQTERYAHAMISRERWRTPADIESAVEIRLDRRNTLDRLSSKYVFYIHEQALRLEVGSANLMYEQMIALTLAAAEPKLELRVVPAKAGARSYFGQDFVLFQYEEHEPLAYLGGAVTALFLEDPTYIATYSALANELASVAMVAEESRSFIAALADEYDRRGFRHATDRVEEEQF
ncbi:helix-turn-helix protein [Labedaea rhizosphaerae]|uniref:Helix-turn-helix protein n=2 Tax=Labedaea rhizosphaerae TaxID=598644 RepID=A0A4R6SJJ1_LABRH|nr:helix-turn-helix protein [Labedaea rhizosphaerae]